MKCFADKISTRKGGKMLLTASFKFKFLVPTIVVPLDFIQVA